MKVLSNIVITVGAWLAANYPQYCGNVTVSADEKSADRKICEDYRDLNLEVPSFSYKRYGFFLSNFVAAIFADRIGALKLGYSGRLFNCGMSAIATVLDALGLKAGDTIICSSVLYGETPKLFERRGLKIVPKDHVTLEFASQLTNKMLSAKAIFVETVGNGDGMPIVNLYKLIRDLWQEEITLIVDNTFLTSVLYNPFEILTELSDPDFLMGERKLRLVYVESLSKHYRGSKDDLVTAGVMVADKDFVIEVDKVTAYTGSYLQYECLQHLPLDLYGATERIMPELSRKARIVAQMLREDENMNVVKVSYTIDYQRYKFSDKGGGVLYFTVTDEAAGFVWERMEKWFGPYKGSFGHPQTTWIPFGKFYSEMPRGLIRLAVGTEDELKDILYNVKTVLIFEL